MATAFVLSGFTSYVVLIVARRSLDPDDFSAFSIFWSLGFLLTATCTSPTETELTRAIAVTTGRGAGISREVRSAVTTVMSTSTLGLAIAIGVVALGEVGDSTPRTGLVFAIILLVAGEGITTVVRACLAGRQQFRSLGLLVASVGVVRALGVAAVAWAGGGPILMCTTVAIAGFVALAFIPQLSGAPSVREAEDSQFSVVGAVRLVLAAPPRALFAVGTPFLAALIATDAEEPAVGEVLLALSITSAPVLIAIALQATLVPRLTDAFAHGDMPSVNRFMRIALLTIPSITLLAAFSAATVGVTAFELVFGAASAIDGAALALMTAGGGLLFLSNVVMPVCVAAQKYQWIGRAWTSGAVVLVAACVVPGPLAHRIGWAVLAGSATVAVIFIAVLHPFWLTHLAKRVVDRSTRPRA